MLDPWIIEEIRRREEEERQERERPMVRIETPQRPTQDSGAPGGTGGNRERHGDDRGVAIIDFTVPY